MDICQFVYPYTDDPATATVVVTSAFVLPLDISYVLNQIANEAIDGSRQTQELANERIRVGLTLPNLEQDEFTNLRDFLIHGVGEGWNDTEAVAQVGGCQMMNLPFLFSDLTRVQAGGSAVEYAVFLDSPPVILEKQGKLYSVSLNMIERI